MRENRGKFSKWIVGVFGTLTVAFLSALVTQWATDRTPEIIVRQYYNTVSTEEVPHRIGDLVLDYQNSPSPLPSPALPYKGRESFGNTPSRGEGIYILEIANEGSAPEEDLRMQAGFPDGVNFSYFGKAPDLRVYQPEEIKLDDESFFVAFKNFPKNALASVSFVPPENTKLLCRIRVKIAGKSKEGKVKSIEGVKCE